MVMNLWLTTFQMQASKQRPDIIVMLEKWESVAHLEAHLATPHMQAHHEAVKDDVVDVKIKMLESGV